MVTNFLCATNSGFFSMVNSFTIPLLVLGSVLGAIIIALANMLGESTHNPKLSLWSKTETVQLFTSLVASILILQGINLFCAVNLADFAHLFAIQTAQAPSTSINLFDGAELYLKEAALFDKGLMSIIRYHLGAYNILEGRYRSKCINTDNEAIQTLACLFGSAISLAGVGGGGAAYSSAPESGYGTLSSALFLSFNTTIFSYLSSLNYLFILRYVYAGMVMFFLPVGVFIRSIPYMRGLGSVLIAFSVSFLFIYPLVLSLFYIDFLTASSVLKPQLPTQFLNADISDKVDAGTAFDFTTTELKNTIFSANSIAVPSQEKEILALTGNGFLIGVFIPSVAMLAAIASTVYLSRLLGEEVDLSRVVQMV